MRFITLFLLSAHAVFCQDLNFSPSQTNQNTVGLDYYNTEYIFITTTSSSGVYLNFELVEEDVPDEWAASGCTSTFCYVSIPEDGSLGGISPGDQAYISINLSVNNSPGDAVIRYRIFDPDNQEINDTLAFIYHAESDTINNTPQPWAKINFYQNVLTVFLKNEFEGSVLSVFDTGGKQIVRQEIQAITAISFKDFEVGVYIVSIESKGGQRITQRVFNGP